ncbi:MAG TPA: ribonuclease H family protein [Bacillales bacterium]|nr:ribonuclease H family protein [Bacillales bacterium]
MKYYAVKKGRKPGIFRSWAECKQQVDGYSGALYKSFTSLDDAKRYLHPEESAPSSSKQKNPNAIEVYVDGSYQASLSAFSYGCIILNHDKQTLSGVGTDPKQAALRNVAGELMGTMKAIEWAVESGYPEILIYHDYAGIANWATGEWQARNDVTRGYVAFINEYEKQIRIRFQKVRAHSGDLHNEEADQLAKQALADYANQ